MLDEECEMFKSTYAAKLNKNTKANGEVAINTFQTCFPVKRNP